MIYVLIPVFNRIELTKRCIESIKNQSLYKEIQIIIVDDGSSDGTSDWIKIHCPEIVILNGTGSLFWCGAIHYGIEFILKIASYNDYVVLVNNDTELEQHTIEKLKKFSDQNKRNMLVSALTCDDKKPHKIIQSGSIVKSWYFNVTEKIFLKNNIKELGSLEAKQVDFLTGRCLMHPIEVFWIAGNYNAQKFRHYGADDEFSMRVKKYGFKTFVLPSAISYLHVGANHKLSLIKTLFSIRSSSNIINKFNLSLAIAPAPAKLSFFIFGVIKSFGVYWKNVFFKG